MCGALTVCGMVHGALTVCRIVGGAVTVYRMVGGALTVCGMVGEALTGCGMGRWGSYCVYGKITCGVMALNAGSQNVVSIVRLCYKLYLTFPV